MRKHLTRIALLFLYFATTALIAYGVVLYERSQMERDTLTLISDADQDERLELTSNSISLFDGEGVKRISVGLSTDQATTFEILDKNGNKRISMAGGADGETAILVHDDQQTVRLKLVVLGHGPAQVLHFDQHGRVRINSGTDQTDSGIIACRDAAGELRVAIGTDNESGAQVGLYDKQGVPRIGIGTDALNNSEILIGVADGTPRIHASVNKHSYIAHHDDAGAKRIVHGVESDKDAALRAYDAEGNLRIDTTLLDDDDKTVGTLYKGRTGEVLERIP